MQIRFHCPTDLCVAIIEYEPLEQCDGHIQCPRCHHSHTLILTESVREHNVVDRCAVCGCTELFLRKDFPQRVGLLVVIVFGLAALYYYQTSFILSWAILASAVLIDLIIYFCIGRVTTCYACRAEYRKGRLNRLHEDFNLATSEKY